MSRLIYWPKSKEKGPAATAAVAAASGGEPPPDSTLGRIGKMVPAEVVAFYLPAVTLITSGDSKVPADILQWVAFAVGLIVTPLYVRKQAKDHEKKTGKKVPWKTQAIITCVSFLFWSYALKGPWGDLYDGVVSALALAVWSVVSGLVPTPFADPDPKP